MNPVQAMQLAMKEVEMQELIKELINYRSKNGKDKFNEKIALMRLLLKDEVMEEITSSSSLNES